MKTKVYICPLFTNKNTYFRMVDAWKEANRLQMRGIDVRAFKCGICKRYHIGGKYGGKSNNGDSI